MHLRQLARVVGRDLADGTVRRTTSCCGRASLMGISEAFYIPAALALIADYHTGATRSRAVGLHQMAIYCGVIMGGFGGSWRMPEPGLAVGL